MAYEIVLTDTARKHYEVLSARDRAMLKDGLQVYLVHEPMKVSRSRIKRLRDLTQPEFRLRLDPYRVFYDVAGSTVIVLAIIPKRATSEWLDKHGVKEK